MLKKHEFWACIALVSMVMCMITGHKMVKPKKQD